MPSRNKFLNSSLVTPNFTERPNNWVIQTVRRFFRSPVIVNILFTPCMLTDKKFRFMYAVRAKLCRLFYCSALTAQTSSLTSIFDLSRACTSTKIAVTTVLLCPARFYGNRPAAVAAEKPKAKAPLRRMQSVSHCSAGRSRATRTRRVFPIRWSLSAEMTPRRIAYVLGDRLIILPQVCIFV